MLQIMHELFLTSDSLQQKNKPQLWLIYKRLLLIEIKCLRSRPSGMHNGNL
jgi:hypothetical protein